MEATLSHTGYGTGITDSIKNTLKNPITFILFLLVVFLTAHTIYQVRRKQKTVGQALNDDVKLLATPTAVVAILGFVMGVGEFIITDNVNQYGLKPNKLFSIPDKNKLKSTIVTLLITSILTGVLTELALKMLPKGQSVSDQASSYKASYNIAASKK